jgi:hypothetical protein
MLVKVGISFIVVDLIPEKMILARRSNFKGCLESLGTDRVS